MKIISTFITILASLAILVAAVSDADLYSRHDSTSLTEFDEASSAEMADFLESMRSYEAKLEREYTQALSTDPHMSELEERQIMDAIKGVKEVVMTVFHAVKDAIQKDKKRRSQFTQDMVSQMANAKKNMNFVMCHTKHTTKFAGQQGKDWYHEHKEFDVKLGGTVGYEIYGFISGEFTRQGDGGYLNWAYQGNVIKKDQGGKHLVFGKR